MNQNKKPWYKRVWVWLLIVIVLVVIGIGASGSKAPSTTTTDTTSGTEATTQPSGAKETPKPEKWDVETAYAKLTDGMTKAEVEAAVGKTSDNCSETSAEYVGKIETCNYGSVGDNGMIMVQYQNDKMTTKSKTKF